MTTEQQLPKGWKIERLGDVLQIQNGYAFKSIEFIKENPENIHIPLIRQSQLVGKVVDVSNCVFLNRKYLIDKKNYIVNKGDILIGMSGSIGKVSFYEEDYPALLNQRVGKLNLYDNDTFQKDFFAYLLISLESSIIQIAKGMGVQNISSKDIEQLKIPIPPLETQQAIVNKIESLFDEIDEGIGRLKTAAQQIQQYRQSLLKNAFNGELTKEWRSKHADTLPSENELLAQIQTTREQHHAQQLADWQNVTIGEVVTISPKKETAIDDNTDVSFSSMHLMSSSISEHLTYEIKKWADVKKGFTVFRNNDVLLAKITPCFENGKSAVAQDLINGIGTGSTEFMVLRCSHQLLPKFLYFLVNTPDFRQAGIHNMTGSVGHKRVPKDFVSSWTFSLPSLTEQTQIVAILESKLTACDQLAAELAKQLKQAELLKQAVLKAAFSGSLLDK